VSSPSRSSSRPSAAAIHEAFLQACGEEGIIAEYRALGVRFIDGEPRRNDCMACYALGREDTSGSAYINVKTGRYGDSGAGGREVDIWQAAANLGLFGGDWRENKSVYLRKYQDQIEAILGERLFPKKKSARRSPKKTNAGSPAPARLTTQPSLPRKPAEPWLDSFRLTRDVSPNAPARTFIAQFCYAKRGFNREAFVAAGGFYSTFPHGRTRDDGTPMDAFQHVVGLPVYGVAMLDLIAADVLLPLDDSHAVGAVIWNKNAEPFEIKVPGQDEPERPKMRTHASADGLIGRHGLTLILEDRRRVAAGLPTQIDRIWKVEGPTDLLALWHSMTPEQRQRQPIISTAGGSTSVYYWMAELIRGYEVVVVHDLDEAGEEGSTKTCETWGPAAKTITPIRLPGEIAAKHGDDVRQRILDGMTFEDLDLLTLAAPYFEVTEAHRAAFAAKLAGEKGLIEATGTAEAPATANAPDFEPNESADDPHRLARNYVEKYATTDGLITIRRWREEWHKWDGGQYRQLGEADLKDSLNYSIKEEFDRLNRLALAAYESQPANGEDTDEEPPFARKVSRTLVADTAAAMAGMHSLPSDRDAPFWIDESCPTATPFPAHEIFATGSGLFHLQSMFDGSPVFQIPSSPNFFSPNSVKYSFPDNDIRQCPVPTRWLNFLTSLWGEDREQIELLQEWMGYCLLPDTSQQKIMLLIGPPRSGKGTICRVLTELVGELNVVNPRLSSFGTEFGIEPLVGKTLGIVSDARLSGRSDIAQIVETLLSISGEDKQTVRRMYKSHINTRLRLRFMIVSNELPALQDASGAFLNRCMLLQTSNTFLGSEDKSLEANLREELPGILVWAAQGWLRIRERGSFIQPATSREMFAELYALTSPIKAFLDECCDIERDRSCLVTELYEAYRKWCEEQGRHASTKQMFGRDLRASLPHIKTEQLWNAGDRTRAFVGLALKPFLT